jgi:hypothetical protein
MHRPLQTLIYCHDKAWRPRPGGGEHELDAGCNDARRLGRDMLRVRESILAWFLALAACGPSPSEPGSSMSVTDSGHDATTGPLSQPACMSGSNAEKGLIRPVEGGFQLDFAEFNFHSDPLTCDSDLSCDVIHLRATIASPGSEIPRVGAYSADDGTVEQVTHSCGCCNGEGGEETWDDWVDEPRARLVIDGADDDCVSGYFEGPTGGLLVGEFLASWCD